jgi:hypothetical protein
MLRRFGGALAQSSAAIGTEALTSVEPTADVWLVEHWIDLFCFGDRRCFLLLTAAGGKATQSGQRQSFEVASSERKSIHHGTYFFGRPTLAEHRLQRLLSVFILAPHLLQRRAFNCLTNLVRGRLRMSAPV